MKAYKVLLVSMVIIGLSLGSFLILQSQATTIEATASIAPHRYGLDDPIPMEFRITVRLPNQYNHEDIDPSTLLVGGLVPMKDVPDWPKIKKRGFSFKIDGPSFMDWVVWPRVWHMTPGPREWVPLDITVAGELYDGTQFEGAFTFYVRTASNDNNRSVPPP